MDARSSDGQTRQNLVNTVHCLVKAADRANCSISKYGFRWSSYGFALLCGSALGQNEGVCVLAMAYNVTGNERYLAEAKVPLALSWLIIKGSESQVMEVGTRCSSSGSQSPDSKYPCANGTRKLSSTSGLTMSTRATTVHRSCLAKE